jgi:predicted ester cyclase
LHLEIEDVIQDGSNVVVRSTITGTQAKEFFGIASKGRKLSIQAVDIHEMRDGKIVRTWHTEDWSTGLRQLGVTGP